MRKDLMISGICALSLIMLIQNAYAQTYEKESASGKVRFQCELEVPENWNGEEIPQFSKRLIFRDRFKFCVNSKN